jgi:hypothetical protein
MFDYRSLACFSDNKVVVLALQACACYSMSEFNSTAVRNPSGSHGWFPHEAFLSSSDDFPISTSCSNGLPLSQSSNLADVSLACKDAKMQAVKHILKLSETNSLKATVSLTQPQATTIQLSHVRPYHRLISLLYDHCLFPRPLCGVPLPLLPFPSLPPPLPLLPASLPHSPSQCCCRPR